MSSSPLVSILIPVYNRETMIVTALSSAMAQTYPNIEIVVVDNCSTDRTFEVVQEYARRDQRIRCFRNEENVGPVRNWMRCLEYSKGDYVKILFSDDWLEAYAVERYLAPLIEHPEAGFSYSSVEIHYETTGKTVQAYQGGTTGLMESFEFLRGQLTGRPSVPVSPGCALFRRWDVEAALGEDIPNGLGLDCVRRGFGSDLLLFLRTCDKYTHVYHVAEVLAHFRGHPSSITIAHSKLSPRVPALCYQSTFAWFLATSNLSRDKKRVLNALLFVRSLSVSHRNAPWRIYPKMFPDEYDCMRMDLLNAEVWQFAARRILREAMSLIARHVAT